MGVWMVKARLTGNDGEYDPEKKAPESRATLLMASVVQGQEFHPIAMVDAHSKEEAVAECWAILMHEARKYGCTELVDIDATEFANRTDLRKALES